MSYSLDSNSDEGRIRVMIYDITSATTPVFGTDYQFEDSYITSMLDQNSDDLWQTSADLCRSLAAKYSKDAIELGLGKGDLKLDLTKRAKFYSDLAISYDRKSQTGGSGGASEFIDSFNAGVDSFGNDISEYIGED